MVEYTRTTPLLHIDHVSLAFGDKLILRDIDVEVRDIERPDCIQGQVVCFLGPSGIGKTQFSRVIAGLQLPTSGQVLLANNVPVHKGLVGMLPQNYPLFDFATVQDNLIIAGRQAGLTKKQVETNSLELMNSFDLYQYRKYYPNQLSGGTRQRVAIIRQLIVSDHLLIMDEPFSGLDLIMKQKACELITQIANRDSLNTIIIVTHDVTEGMSVADTVWLMGREPGQQGARVVEQYDLAKEGFCWQPGIATRPDFMDYVANVKNRFKSLL